MLIEIKVKELEDLLYQILTLRNITGEIADFMVFDFLEAELEGHQTHGVGKILLLDEALEKRKGSPKVILQQGNYAKVDGNKEIGHIAAMYSIDLAIELARKNKNSIVSLVNASRYGRLKPFARKIAKEGFVGIIMNNGGPSAVTPYGGISPVYGTNPICFSFPGNNPNIVDFSTAKEVWGEVRQSILENRELSKDCFIDKQGNYTKDPDKVNAVEAFGGKKGSSLCYAIEVLTGAFVGAKMGLQVKDEYDLGFVFMVLSPEMFGNKEVFLSEVEVLSQEVKGSRKDGQRAYVPGEYSKMKYEEVLEKGTLMIAKETFNRLNQMSKDIKGGLKSNDKVN